VLETIPRRDRKRHAEQLLSEVRLPPASWQRRPAELSGGESQRLALARALAPNPELLLLDEPLVQLDAPMREELLQLIRCVAADRGMTVIYVTHAWAEVAEVGRQVAVLVSGRLEQTGTLDAVFQRPISPAVARLTGPIVEIPRQLLETGLIVQHPRPQAWPAVPLTDGDVLIVRPQQLQVVSATARTCWTVVSCRPHASSWRLSLNGNDDELQIDTGTPVAPGQLVSLQLLTGVGSCK
jgi:ABC-type sulfate/molybdate transport systems ATPase subunit